MDIHKFIGIVLILVAATSALFTRLAFQEKPELTKAQKTFHKISYTSDIVIAILGMAIYLGYIFD